MDTTDNTQTEASRTATLVGTGDLVMLSWPDRPGFWWLKDRWGMVLAESYEHNDPDWADDTSFAVRGHGGGDFIEGPWYPCDIEDGCFLWLGASFPHNNEGSRAR